MGSTPLHTTGLLALALPATVITRAEPVTRDTVVTWEISFKACGKARSLTVDPVGKPIQP